MKKTLRLLVCGGREFTDAETLNAAMDRILGRFNVQVVIAGGARGADRLAAAWARSRGIEVQEYPVTKEEWAFFGKRAGTLRNTKMLDEGFPTGVVAFPCGTGDQKDSPGTYNMIYQATLRGLPVWLPLLSQSPTALKLDA